MLNLILFNQQVHLTNRGNSVTITELFSRRQKRLRGDVPDVYTYDDLPQSLKVQIVHIWTDTLGNTENHYSYSDDAEAAYKYIVKTLCREYGIFKLPSAEKYGDREYLKELANYFIPEPNVEKSLDVIELAFKVINTATRNYQYLARENASLLADRAIDELNRRFKEHGIGFQFVENQIIRIDSELLHVETVRPALRLLNQKKYKGAHQEFLSSFEHYRNGKNKEALNDCLKSFESTLKAICDKRKWKYPPNATSNALIKLCFDNNLVPDFWQQQLTSLRSMLESGIPTGRNNLSAHGQGTAPISIPNYLVAYMLHMTASTLVFLTTAEENL